MKVLYIRIDREIHSQAKRLAAFKYTSLENWVRQAVAEKIEREKSFLKDNKIP